MKVKDIMCKHVKVLKPDTTLREAAKKMHEHEMGYFPVGEEELLIGAITDRDIIVRGLALDHNPDEVTVSKIMTGYVISCFEDDDIEVAAETMKEKQVRRLVALNEHERITGVISIGDIARNCKDNPLTGEIEKYVST